MFPNLGSDGEGGMLALVFDHDESRQKRIALALQEDNFNVIEIIGSSHALNQLPEGTDLIIVDEDMPPEGGLKWVSLLRCLTDVPIIMMGAGATASLVAAVCRGADLYLERAVNIREFLARIHALLRRYSSLE
jgi:DNA-binding response OmpR family regulator